MPIYEFSCLDCSTESEVLVRSSNWKGTASCPECGSKKLEKKLSVFSPSSSDGQNISSDSLPPCSGMPSDCGRCGLDN
ncbi:MAG: zinc ribbon domain-containing protein [Verrucomicrobiota bacterium]|nr:zinc ribbon domain-containing protein [Verrucomicrobiota bacterium]